MKKNIFIKLPIACLLLIVPQINMGMAMEKIETEVHSRLKYISQPENQQEIADLGKILELDLSGLVAKQSCENHQVYNRLIDGIYRGFISSDDIVLKKPSEFIKIYKQVAKRGFAVAQNNLGVMYQNGLGVPRNFLKGFLLCQLAANQGNVRAQCNLGFMYDKGEGISQDYSKALELYQKAADQGFADAQHNLGFMYQYGEGIPQDLLKAIHFYQLAADQGNARAQNNLGLMYKNGTGTQQNYSKAILLYQLSADQENKSAQSNLGFMHYMGLGIPQDYSKSFHLYQQAADQGEETAQSNLGLMYANGQGTIKDLSKACQWFQKSADQGDVNARCNLKFTLRQIIRYHPQNKKYNLTILSQKYQSEISDLMYVLHEMESFFYQQQTRNDPISNFIEKSSAISSLGTFCKQCARHTQEINEILIYLRQENKEAGFLISNLLLREEMLNDATRTSLTSSEATYIHIIPVFSDNTLFFFSHGSLENLRYSKKIKSLYLLDNIKSFELKCSIDYWIKIYEMKKNNIQSDNKEDNEIIQKLEDQDELLTKDNLIFLYDINSEFDISQMTKEELLKEKDLVFINFMKKINLSKEKLLEILITGAPLRNSDFVHRSSLYRCISL